MATSKTTPIIVAKGTTLQNGVLFLDPQKDLSATDLAGVMVAPSGDGILSLNGGSTVVFGKNAKSAGISKVMAQGGGNTVSVLPNIKGVTISASGGDNEFILSSVAQLSDLSISGGAGSNSLMVLGDKGPVTISDGALALTTGIDALVLGSKASLTLGPQSTFLHTVDGSAAGMTLLRESGGSPLTVIGGYKNLIQERSGDLFRTDSIVGGTSQDTLEFLSTVNLVDSDFSRALGIEVLKLTGGSAVTLGSAATAAGINVVISGNDAASTLNHSASAISPVTLVGGAAGTRFVESSAALLKVDSLVAGAGSDTLEIQGNVPLSDAAFGKIKNIEALVLNGAPQVTLDAAAKKSGIRSIFGASGSVTITQTAANNVPLMIQGGSGGDLINIATRSLLSTDTVDGGSGSDTIQMGTAEKMDDSAFKLVTGVEFIQLKGGTSFTPGPIASASGLVGIIAGPKAATLSMENIAVGSTLNAALNTSAADSLKAGPGGTDFIVSSKNASKHTIQGGAGLDTLELSEAATLNDGFSNISSVEQLLTRGASKVTLGSAAKSAGIDTLTSSGCLTLNAIGFAKTLTAVITGSNDQLTLGSYPNLILSSTLSNRETIYGGGKDDTLALTASGLLTDSLFSNIHSVEALSLKGSSSVVLDASANAAGIRTIYGGSGSSTFTQGTNNTQALNLAGTALSDLFSISTANQLSADTIAGGGGVDTVAVSGTVADNAFSKVSGVEVLSLTGSSSVTYGANAKLAGISTVVAGAGAQVSLQAGTTNQSLFVQANGTSDLVSLGSGNDLISEGALNATDTIAGGGGTDTLAISTAATITDANFNKVSSVEVLSLTGSSSVTFNSAAQAAGISTVVAGAGAQLSLQAGTTNQSLSVQANGTSDLVSLGSGSDLVRMGGLDASDTIAGGGGTDTLAISTAATITDASFAKVSGVEVLSLTGSSSVTFNSAAQGAGISTVVAGAGAQVSLQAGTTNQSLSVLANGTSDLVSLGSGSDLVRMGALDASDTIAGGDGVDTVAVSGTVADNAFSKVSGVEVLSLTGSSSVTYGANAKLAGISTVVAGAGAQVSLQAGTTNQSLSVLANGTSDLLSLGSGSDLVRMGALDASDTIAGGDGVDTVAVSGTVADNAFSKVSGVEVLSLTGSSSVTFNSAAQAAGISTVVAGAGAQLSLQAGATTQSLSVLANGTSDLVSLGSGSDLVRIGALDASDTIAGGDGVDTVAVSGTVADNAFSKVSGVEVLSLTGSSSVTFNSAAQAAGISTVVAGAGAQLSLQAGATTQSLSVQANGTSDLVSLGSGSDLVRMGALDASDTIAGGDGVDTVAVSGTVADNAFANDSGIEILSLTGTSSVTYGANAKLAGISTVVAGAGAQVSLQAGTTTQSLFVQANGTSDLVSLGSGNDLVRMGGLDASDTIAGGGGTDTLAISTAGTISDASFAKVSSVEVLSLTGSSSVVLDASANAAGIRTIYGGSGSSTFTQGTNNTQALNLAGTALSDLFSISTANQLAADTIAGGGGVDTVAVSGTVADNAFTNDSGIEILSLTGTSSVTYGANAKLAGISTVVAGAGAQVSLQAGTTTQSLFVQANGTSDLVSLGSGNDLVRMGALDASDTIAGGGGTDTLAISTAGTISDASFAKVSSVEVLSLTGSSSVVLDASANAAGIRTIYGGSGSSTFTQGTNNTQALNLAGTALSDLFSISTANQLSADTIAGGGGVDTVAVTGTVADNAFANDSGIEILSLTGSSSVTYGANAKLAGISTVVAGAGAQLSLQAGTATQGLFVQANGTSDLVSLGSGNDLVRMGALNASDTIAGGGGTDTLAISTAATITDASFAKVGSVEVLSLTGSSSVTYGANAKLAGISTVVAGAGAQVSLQAGTTNQSLFVQANGTSDLVVLGSGNDLISEGALDASDTIAGGGGTDTLAISTAGTISDASFAKVSSVEVLSLTGASSVVFDANANAAGIVTVYGGNGATTFTQRTSNTLALNLVGSTLSDLFSISTASQLGSDSIIGGSGTDTLVLSSAATISDASFANVNSVEVLSLTGSSSISLSTSAQTAGIATVVAGTGAQLSLQAGALTQNLSIQANGTRDLLSLGSGNDLVSIGALSSSDTIAGGGGTDTLAISAAATMTDDSFIRVRSVEVLSLTGSSSVSYGGNAKLAGISTVVAGAGAQLSLQAGAATQNLSVQANGTRDLVSLGSGNDLVSIGALNATDTIAGGGGTDTLAISTAATITDANFNKVSSVEVLSLTGSSSVTFNSAAQAAGISTVVAGAGAQLSLQAGAVTQKLSVLANGTRDLLSLGSGNDLVRMGALDASDTIAGGAGVDTVAVSGTLSDSVFGKVSSVEVLSLTGSSSVTLDSLAQAAGIAKIVAGNGAVTIAQGKNNTVSLNVVGSAQNDFFSLSSASQLAVDTIAGGSGIDTVGVAGTLSDNLFSNSSGIEVLSLTGSSSVTLDSAAQTAGISTVVAGAGAQLSLQAGAWTQGLSVLTNGTSDLVSLGSANDLVRLGLLDTSDTIDGGDGVDTLALGPSATITDSSFGKVRSMEVLSLTGSSSVTLDSLAQATGITSVYGGSGNATITQGANNTTALYLVGSTLNDLFSIVTASQLTADTIDGGAGADTVAVSGAIADSAFTNVSGTEVLSLTGSSSVELDSEALAAGISTVVAGAGAQLTLQAGTSTQNLRVLANGTSDLVALGTGNDLVRLGALDSTDTITGGDGTDTLAISTAATITDANFNNISSVEVLSLTGSSSVVLDAGARVAGIVTVYGGSGGAKITQGVGDSQSLNLIGSSLNDLFSIGSDSQFAADTITGGAGVDTVAVSGTVADRAFRYDSSIEVLSLTGSSSVTYGANAKLAGISTVVAGAGAQVSFQAGTATQGLFVQANGTSDLVSLGSGNDLISEGALNASDTIAGGGGTDTLAISTAATITDASLAKVSSVEVLSLTGSSSVVFDANANAAGIVTVYGGNAATTITQGVGDTQALNLIGSSLNDLFSIGSDSQFAADMIAGGDGVDTVAVSGTVADNAFSKVSGVEVLSLTGSSSVTYGANAKLAGISTVVAGAGAQVSLQAGTTNQSLSVQANGTRDLVSLGSGDDLVRLGALDSSDTIDGGAGVDTLSVTAPVALEAVNLASTVRNVEVLKLADGGNTIDVSGVTGLQTVIGGAGNDSFTWDAGSALYLDGGVGVDTLSITTPLIADAGELASTVKNIEVLQLADGGNTIDVSGVTGLQTVIGGAGSDSFTWDAGNPLTLIGGVGVDTLSITAPIIADAGDLASTVRNVEVLKLADGGNTIDISGVTGLQTVIGGAGGDRFTWDLENPVYFRGGVGIDTLALSYPVNAPVGAISATTQSIEVLQLADGDNTLDASGVTGLQTVIGGAGNDSFTWDAGSALYLDGGVGVDTLSITAPLISDAGELASTVKNIEVLQLADGGNTIDVSGVTGLQTVIGGAGSDSFTWDAGNPLTLIGGGGVDTLSITAPIIADAGELASTVKNVEVLKLADGGNTIDVSGVTGLQTVIGGAGGDRFTWDLENPVYFRGGEGIDTLALSSPVTAQAGVIGATAGGIEVLKLADGGNNVDLSGATGIMTVIGGADGDTLTAGATGVTLQAWSGSAASNSSSDTLRGGAGSDLFILGDARANAYGHGGTSVAVVKGFDAAKDILQLHDLGGSHAGFSGYQTLPGASGQVDIFTYGDTVPGNHVASVCVTNGAFDLMADVRLV